MSALTGPIGSPHWANRRSKNSIGEYYGNYYIIFPETRCSANPCRNN
jgi:hypothetical protein